jgi:hypothetical protein
LSSPRSGDRAGRYRRDRFFAEVVSTSPDANGIRVTLAGSPLVSAYLDAVHPQELPRVVEAFTAAKKHALEPLTRTDLGPPRQGWLLDPTTPREARVWSEETGRSATVDVRMVLLAFELYARTLLFPTDGQLPDADLPGWVDPVRQAHVQLLTTLDAIDQAPLEPHFLGHRGRPFAAGRFESPRGRALVAHREGTARPELNPVVVVEPPVLRAFFAAGHAVERVAAMEHVRFGRSFTWPALPDLPVPREQEWVARVTDDRVDLSAGDQQIGIGRDALLALLELDARAILAPWEGGIVTVDGPVKPWVGRARRVHVQVRGRVTDLYERV